MKHLKLLLLSLLLVACYGQKSPEKPKLDIKDELAKIEQTRNGFMLAIEEKRYQDLGKYTTANMERVGPATTKWMEMYKQGQDRGAFPYDRIIMNPRETVIVSDSVAYDYGTSQVFYTNETGEEVMLTNSFLVIMKKVQDGSWRLHREVASGQVK